jgi:hypothetical protein
MRGGNGDMDGDSRSDRSPSIIPTTYNRSCAALENAGNDHRSLDILVPKVFLHKANIAFAFAITDNDLMIGKLQILDP